MYISFEESGINKSLNNLQLAKIYAGVFASKDGKIVLEDLARASGMYRTNFAQNSGDYTSFLEGQRALFLYICSQLEDQVDNIDGDTNKREF